VRDCGKQSREGKKPNKGVISSETYLSLILKGLYRINYMSKLVEP
jgi:hypothetical protein